MPRLFGTDGIRGIANVDLKPTVESLGLKAGKVMHVVYTAVEGRSQGLPVYDAIELLGRESALRRLRAARARL